MRKIKIEVPDKKCSGCSAVIMQQDGLYGWGCPFREDTSVNLDNAKPIQACIKSTINESRGMGTVCIS